MQFWCGLFNAIIGMHDIYTLLNAIHRLQLKISLNPILSLAHNPLKISTGIVNLAICTPVHTNALKEGIYIAQWGRAFYVVKHAIPSAFCSFNVVILPSHRAFPSPKPALTAPPAPRNNCSSHISRAVLY